MSSPRVLISANSAWFLSNFRSAIISAMVEHGLEVVAATNPNQVSEARLTALGCRFQPINIDSRGLSPTRDGRTLLAYRRLLKEERPHLLLGSTIKPNIYGGLAARQLGIPVINDISGLGTAFIRQTWVTSVVELLYRASLARSHTVFFQNVDDRALFLERGLVRPAQARLVPGSGVNLDDFHPLPLPERPPGLTFLLIARLVADKGVNEFVHAARILKRERPEMRFLLLGFAGVENRTAISKATLDGWVEEGVVSYAGATTDVRPHIAAADCIVLPSYREGTSRVLLEAAAMAKPIVATDVPGCRNVVAHEVTGFLCQARDTPSLEQALRRMMSLTPLERAAMGAAGREKMIREFDERIVVRTYLEQVMAALEQRER